MHKLLSRQLKRAFGSNIPNDDAFQAFISMINDSYEHNEADRLLIERAMELSSEELSVANAKLKEETKNQKELLYRLLDSITLLAKSESEVAFLKELTHSENSQDLLRLVDHLRKLAEERKQNEALLLLQEARMTEAQQLAKFGTWTYTYDTNQTEWSENLEQIFNQDSFQLLNDENYLNLVYEEDQKEVQNELKRLQHRSVVTLTHRILQENSEVKWIEASFKLTRNIEGKPYQLLGTALDITGQKMAEFALEYKVRELEETSSFLDTVLEEMPLSIFVKDAHNRKYIKFNRIGLEMLELTQTSIIGLTNIDLFEKDIAAMYNHQDDEVLRTKSIFIQNDEPFLKQDGTTLYFRTQKVPVFDQLGEVKYILTISEDVTERRKIEDQIRKAAQIADEANKAKSAFLSSMSHELRTPLNAIIGFSQILQRDKEIPAQQRSYVETMYRSGNHLLAMINDVLDISKIESGKFDLSFEPFSLREIAHDLESMFSLKALEKGLSLHISSDSDLPPVLYSDSKRIQQVLINLMGNAIKFTSKGTVGLHIRATPIPDTSSYQVEFMVSDSGRGIPENQLVDIFEPFRQVKGFHSDGTGLGLAISSKIAEMLEGEITVKSKLGKGSIFTFSLPVEAAYDDTFDQNDDYKPVKSVIGSKIWRILVVDDIANNRAVVRAFLESIGFECIEADNGHDAVMMAELFKPDVVFMDIMMPGMNGEEAFKRIRSNFSLNHIKIIALTASGSVGKKQELLEMGFDEYITKPYREKWLIHSLERCAGVQFEYETNEELPLTVQEDSPFEKSLLWLTNQSSYFKHEFNEAAEIQDFKRLKQLVLPFSTVAEEAQIISNFIEKEDHLFFITLSERLIV